MAHPMNGEEVNSVPLSSEGPTLDPADWNTFRAQAHRMLDDMLDYIQNIRERPVWQPMPDDVRSGFKVTCRHRRPI